MTKHIINNINGRMPAYQLIDILEQEDPEGIYNIGLEAIPLVEGEKPYRTYWSEVGLGCLSVMPEGCDNYICNNQGFSFEKVNMKTVNRVIFMQVR